MKVKMEANSNRHVNASVLQNSFSKLLLSDFSVIKNYLQTDNKCWRYRSGICISEFVSVYVWVISVSTIITLLLRSSVLNVMRRVSSVATTWWFECSLSTKIQISTGTNATPANVTLESSRSNSNDNKLHKYSSLVWTNTNNFNLNFALLSVVQIYISFFFIHFSSSVYICVKMIVYVCLSASGSDMNVCECVSLCVHKYHSISIANVVRLI